MSVTSEDNKASYVAAGSATYVIPFYFTAAEHIRLIVDDIEKLLNTDFTVSGEGDEDGGVLTLIGSPYSSGESVVILREVPVTQEDTLTEGGPNSARNNERRFDKLTMIAQQIAEGLSRAIKFPLTSSVDTQMTGTVVPNGLLMFDADGTALTCGPDAISYASGVEANSVAAANSANAAATSASNAATSATNSSNSASAASTSATNAANSASAASTSASAASSSASAASASATNAASSETAANTSATNAANSAASASTSASSAAASASTATTKAGEATDSQVAASAAASAANTAAANASASAASAASSASSFSQALYATESIASNGQISKNTNFIQHRKVQGNGGAVTVNAAPFGSSGLSDGIMVRLIGQSDTNTLTVPYADAGYGCLLNGDAELKKGYVLTLLFDATALRWYEISRNF